MKEYTATGLISGGPTTLTYVKVITDGTNTAKAVLHNNTSAAGDVVDETTVLATNHYGGGNIDPPSGIRCSIGLYLTLTGTGAPSVIIKNT